MKDLQRLRRIYDKTDGYCHLCHKKLSFTNYGNAGGKGAWNIEHSKPKNKGGTDNLNNLFPACINCNTEKGTKHTKTIRKKNGVSRAPYSKKKKESIRTNNTLGGAAAGALFGSFFGPGGAFASGILDGLFGDTNSPKK